MKFAFVPIAFLSASAAPTFKVVDCPAKVADGCVVPTTIENLGDALTAAVTALKEVCDPGCNLELGGTLDLISSCYEPVEEGSVAFGAGYTIAEGVTLDSTVNVGITEECMATLMSAVTFDGGVDDVCAAEGDQVDNIEASATGFTVPGFKGAVRIPLSDSAVCAEFAGSTPTVTVSGTIDIGGNETDSTTDGSTSSDSSADSSTSTSTGSNASDDTTDSTASDDTSDSTASDDTTSSDSTESTGPPRTSSKASAEGLFVAGAITAALAIVAF
jgi:hypothetical protein